MIRQSFSKFIFIADTDKNQIGTEGKTTSHRNLLGIKRSHNSWI
jgi:hypothetical protein